MKYRQRFLAFFSAMVLFALATSFAHPVTPTVIKQLQLNDYMFGVALAVMMSANFLMSPFWGRINGYISSRVSLLVCCCGYGVAQIIFAEATGEFGIVLARFLGGIFVGGSFVSFLTYIVNAAEHRDQASFLTYSATIQSVGSAFGYLIGGLIGELSVKAAFYAQAACLILSGVLFFLICRPDVERRGPIPIAAIARQANPLKAFLDCRSFMTPAFALVFAYSVLINFGNTGFDQAFNYFLKDQLGLTSGYNGVIKAAVGLVSFAANMTLCIYIIKRPRPARALAGLAAACALSAAATALLPGTGSLVVFGILVYAGYSVSLPVNQNMAANLAGQGQRNLVMGFYNSTKSLGSIAGSLTAGFIYSQGPRVPFACTAAIYAAAVAAALWYMRTVRGERRKEL